MEPVEQQRAAPRQVSAAQAQQLAGMGVLYAGGQAGVRQQSTLSARASEAIGNLEDVHRRLVNLTHELESRLDGPAPAPPVTADPGELQIPDGLAGRIDLLGHQAERLSRCVDHIAENILERL